ncbi:DUF2946 domain-containing protein [Pseudomonas sp. J452]|uniref:DUF2946 domain-containing protein n=1 Tax=Pseudomonas sp. J452 TaxID=2898441 RepID=UPI0021AE1136|nr:DUF2946 domain-containing protein [Pseudomonas sp. J452]UUY09528.1 DUF2946 domain-containing protein [Pseudomonas sp. J452]
MPSTHLLSATRLALLAMFLLAFGPLLSQALVPAGQGAVPGWMSELSCAAEDGSPHAAGGHDALWAKCGYCTLLFTSPALTSSQPPVLARAPLAAVSAVQRQVAAPYAAPPFPTAHPRAPPVLSS